MATTIKLKNGSGAPLAGDLVQGEPALDLTNKRLYTEDSGGTVIEVGTNPTSLTTGTFTSTGIDDNATSTAITIDSSQNTFFSSANTHAASVNVASFANTTTGQPVAIAFGAVADNGGAGNEGGIYFDAGADGSAADNQLQFNADHQSSITPDMVITGSGNVGIGTTSPLNSFVVAEGTGQHGIELAPGTTSYIQAYDRAISDYGDLKIDAQIIQFGTDNGTERMRIDSSGNVGIGNSSPSAWSSSFSALQIGQAASFWAVDTLPYAYMSANQFYDGASKYIVNGAATWYVQELGTHKWFIAPSGTAGNTISFTQAMTLDASGNVGIGTTSPASALHVDSSNDGPLFDSGGTGNTNHALLVRDSNLNQLFRVNNNGKVGIGTESPAYVLDVYNSAVSQISASRSGGSRVVLGTDTSTGEYVGTISNTVFKILTNSTERMRIDSSGNVGIGTTSPTGKLHVATTSGNAVFVLSSGTAGEANITFGDSADISRGEIKYDNTNESMQFTVNNLSEAMRIDSSGNVMVGKTNTLVSGQGLILKPLGDTYCSITNGYNTLHVYDTTNSLYRFYVSGSGQVSYYSLNQLSDEREKQNIVDIPHGLTAVMGLKPRQFDWKEKDQANGVYGFVAQEVEAVLPSLLGEYKKDENTTRKSLKQVELIPVLTKAIQEQQAMIEELKAEVAALKGA